MSDKDLISEMQRMITGNFRGKKAAGHDVSGALDSFPADEPGWLMKRALAV